MLVLIVGVVIGLAIGWTIPQPQFVTDLIAKVKAKLD